MFRNIVIEVLDQKPISKRDIEIVERKGVGHPDYLIDGACEAVSKALSRYYLNEFGAILHHNVDKGLLVGGKATVWFGGGRVEEPIHITIAGRAVTSVVSSSDVKHVPIGKIVLSSVKEFLNNSLRFLDVGSDVIVDYKIRPGSIDLVSVFNLEREIPLANDTSFGVSFAPLTPLEKLVLETERYLNSTSIRKSLPEVGEDIKVMGLRRGGRIELTIAAAMISRLTPNLSHYLSVKEEVKRRIEDLTSKITDIPVEVIVNDADKPDKGIVYLTVTGTSAESGDDGNTGRGNRVHGLITPSRYMSLEATAGKNPVNHVGKLYNVLADIIANRIYREVKGIEEVYVKLLSRIGTPIDKPLIADIQFIPDNTRSIENIKSEIYGIVDGEFNNIKRLTGMILNGECSLF